MGITEDRNTEQIHFCFMCNGPGTSRWDDTRRICVKCRRLFQTWNVSPPAEKPPRVTVDPWEKQEYAIRRRVFLRDNPFCWVALLVFKRLERSQIVHHRKGRRLHYLDESTWLPTTKEGDQWIHRNVAQAKRLGFII